MHSKWNCLVSASGTVSTIAIFISFQLFQCLNVPTWPHTCPVRAHTNTHTLTNSADPNGQAIQQHLQVPKCNLLGLVNRQTLTVEHTQPGINKCWSVILIDTIPITCSCHNILKLCHYQVLFVLAPKKNYSHLNSSSTNKPKFIGKFSIFF